MMIFLKGDDFISPFLFYSIIMKYIILTTFELIKKAFHFVF